MAGTLPGRQQPSLAAYSVLYTAGRPGRRVVAGVITRGPDAKRRYRTQRPFAVDAAGRPRSVHRLAASPRDERPVGSGAERDVIYPRGAHPPRIRASNSGPRRLRFPLTFAQVAMARLGAYEQA